MFHKLLSFHYTVSTRGISLNEVIQNAYRRALYEYVASKCSLCVPVRVNGRTFREFHIYGPNRKGEDRREMYASLPRREEGTDGEKGVDIDAAMMRCVRYELYFSFQVVFKMAIKHCFLLQSARQDGVFVALEMLFKLWY
jgi:hypothetical protein